MDLPDIFAQQPHGRELRTHEHKHDREHGERASEAPVLVDLGPDEDVETEQDAERADAEPEEGQQTERERAGPGQQVVLKRDQLHHAVLGLARGAFGVLHVHLDRLARVGHGEHRDELAVLGDQPNNALSLNVFEPGEVAATAGTSGVVYGVSGEVAYDPLSRVNTFAHVNHDNDKTRLGILLCINGASCLNSWVRRNFAADLSGYPQIDILAGAVPAGCCGIGVLPFGNGAERMLMNKDIGCRIYGINFNRTDRNYILRAEQEGIVYAFKYGMDIMSQMGMKVEKIHAGNANMLLSPVFREALASVTGASIELYDTDGAAGAARGAGIGAGIYAGPAEAFASLERVAVIEPGDSKPYQEAYARWTQELSKAISE